MTDVTLDPGATFQQTVREGAFQAVVAVSGSGVVKAGSEISINERDFAVIENAREAVFTAGSEGLRLVIVEAPAKVDYPLYSR